MNTRIQVHKENVNAIRVQLLDLLSGLDYCLDWKPDESDWSAREVVYHLLDTPPGGAPFVVRGIVAGEVAEYEVVSGLTNMTSDRSVFDMEQVTASIVDYFEQMSEVLSSVNEPELDEKTVLVHFETGAADENQTLEHFVTAFDRHWRDHLSQIKDLRDALGF